MFQKIFTLIALLTLFLTACGGATPTAVSEAPTQVPTQAMEPTEAAQPTQAIEPTQAAEPTTAISPTEEPVQAGPTQGGTLVVALGSDPENLNTSITSSVTVGLPAGTITEGLIRIDRDYNVHPVLAESWEVSDDGLQFTFHLREGVRWHDGEPFTSEDVKFTLENVSTLHGRAGVVIDHITSVETPDDHTVVVTLDAPFGPFLSFLSNENVGIQPKHIYEGTDILENPANLAPIGTGPFVFSDWTPGESIEVVRNDDYWGAPRPYLDRIIFRIIPDSSARVLALESGEVDFISNYDMNFVDVPRLIDNPDLYVELGRGHPRVLLLFFNTTEEPFSDPEVRKALFTALDRELMLDAAFGGIGSLGRSSIPPGLGWAYNPDIDYMEMFPYDPEAAAAQLDEAGYPVGQDGTRFEARFVYDPAQPGFSDVADILRFNWEEIGVKVSLEARERAVWIDQLYINKDFDTGIAFYTTSGDPTLGVQRAYHCADIREAGFTNASQYCNPELDDLFDRATSAVDREERAQLYYQAQEIIARDLPTAVLIDSGFADVIRNSYGGLEEFFVSPETTTPQWDKIYLKSE